MPALQPILDDERIDGIIQKEADPKGWEHEDDAGSIDQAQ